MGDNGILNQAQQAKKETDKASFLEKLNYAYTDAYLDYVDAGDVSHVITMTDVYDKLSTELKSRVYIQNGDNLISLSNPSQISITLLDSATAIGCDGNVGYNTQSIVLEEGQGDNQTNWGEVSGKYFPIILDTTN